MVVLPKPPLFT